MGNKLEDNSVSSVEFSPPGQLFGDIVRDDRSADWDIVRDQRSASWDNSWVSAPDHTAPSAASVHSDLDGDMSITGSITSITSRIRKKGAVLVRGLRDAARSISSSRRKRKSKKQITAATQRGLADTSLSVAPSTTGDSLQYQPARSMQSVSKTESFRPQQSYNSQQKSVDLSLSTGKKRTSSRIQSGNNGGRGSNSATVLGNKVISTERPYHSNRQPVSYTHLTLPTNREV